MDLLSTAGAIVYEITARLQIMINSAAAGEMYLVFFAVETNMNDQLKGKLDK